MHKILLIKFFILLFFTSFACFGQSDTSMYIIVTAGQSNMSGRAAINPEDTISYPNVFNLTKDSVWVKAKNPIHYDNPSVGVGPVMTCVKELLLKYGNNIKIGIVPCAVGGTSIENWVNNANVTGVNLHQNLIARAKFATKYGKLIGVIWHQGEQNGAPWVYNDYRNKLKTVLNNIRKDLNDPYLPIVAGELGDFYLSSLYYEYKNYINIDINALKTELHNVGIASAKDLVSRGDNLHFNTASQHIFGQRYAQALFPLMNYIKSDSVFTFVKDTFNIDISLKQYIPDSIKKIQFDFKYDTNLVAYNKFVLSDSILLKGDLQVNAVKGVVHFQFLSDSALCFNHNKKLIQFSFISLKTGLSSTQFQNVILNDTNFVTSIINNKIFSKADLPSFKFDSVNTQVSKKANVVVQIIQLKPHIIKSFNFDFVYDTLMLDFKKVSLLNPQIKANKVVITPKKGRISISWNDSISIQFANNDSILKIEYVSINEGVTNPFFENVFFDSLAMNYNFNSKITSKAYNTYIQSDWVVDFVFKSVSVPIKISQINPLEILSFNFSVSYDTSRVRFQDIVITDSILGNNGKLNVINDTAGVLNFAWKGDFPLKKYDDFTPFVIKFLTTNEGVSFNNILNAYIDSFPVTSVSDGAIIVKPYLPVIAFDSVKTSVDKTFKIPFYVKQKQPKDLYSFQFTFYYDENKLEFLGYEFKDSLENKGDVYYYFNNGAIILGWSSNTPIQKSSKIDILDFKFRSKGEGYTNPYIFDPMVNNTTIDSVVNGSIYSEKHTIALESESVFGKVGKQVELPLRILQLNPYEIGSLSFDIEYDTLKLSYQNYSLSNTGLKEINNLKIEKNLNGGLTVTWSSDSIISANEITVLLSLNFKLLNEGVFDVYFSNVKFDDYTIVSTKKGVIVSNPNLPEIHFDNIKTGLDKKFTLPIYLSQEQAKDINQFSFELNYDTLKLEFVSHTFTKDNNVSVIKDNGKIAVNWENQTGFTADSIINIIQFTFKAIQTGDANVDFANVIVNQGTIDSIVAGSISIENHYSTLKTNPIISGAAKKTFEVPIYCKQINPYPISNFKFIYHFNDSKLKYKGLIIDNQKINHADVVAVNQGDSIVVEWNNSLDNISASDSINLLSLEFYSSDTSVTSANLKTVYIDSIYKNYYQNQTININYQYGDVDNNGIVNTDDALLLLNYSVGLPNDSIQWQGNTFTISDVNFSNKITASDAASILQYTNGDVAEFTKGVDANSKIAVSREGNYFVFKTVEKIQALNLSIENNFHLVSAPVDLYTRNNLYFTTNINDTTYNIALASTIAIDSGTVLFKIPYNELASALYTFDILVNNSTQKVIFDLILGVSNKDNMDNVASIKVYPNYNLNKLIVKDYPANSNISIFNSQGIEIYKSDNLNQAIYLSDLPGGLLIVQVKNQIETNTTKIVIEH